MAEAEPEVETAAEAGVRVAMVTPVTSARLAAAASTTLGPRCAADLGGWVTKYPLFSVAAAHVGASGRTGVRACVVPDRGITAWSGDAARR